MGRDILVLPLRTPPFSPPFSRRLDLRGPHFSSLGITSARKATCTAASKGFHACHAMSCHVTIQGYIHTSPSSRTERCRSWVTFRHLPPQPPGALERIWTHPPGRRSKLGHRLNQGLIVFEIHKPSSPSKDFSMASQRNTETYDAATCINSSHPPGSGPGQFNI